MDNKNRNVKLNCSFNSIVNEVFQDDFILWNNTNTIYVLEQNEGDRLTAKM